jgi:hypothetical protein
MELWRISGPRWTFGVLVRDGRVVESAPLSKWAIGKRISVVVNWWRKNGADQISRHPTL